MSELVHPHSENYNRSKVYFVAGLSFLLGFLDAYFIYLVSSYFLEVGGSEQVGAFYLIVFSLAFAAFFFLSGWLRRMGQVRLFLLLLTALVACSSFLSLRDPSWIGSAVLLLFLIMNTMLWTVLDIVLEGYSADGLSGRIRGLHLTVANTGFLFAPLLSAWTMGKFGFGGVFTVLTLGYSIVFVLALLGLRNGRRVVVAPLRFRETWSKFRTQTNLLRIYYISFTVEFFYAIMVVYTPIYLVTHLGFSWDEVGVIFTIMLLPFVFLQYPVGVLADKRFGEKELLIGALVIMVFGTLAMTGVRSQGILVWGALLFLTRVGSAALEVLRDSYFYKQIAATDADIIVFFRTARSVGNIAGAILATGLLLFAPLSGIFWLVGGVAATALYPAFRLVDTKSERERMLT